MNHLQDFDNINERKTKLYRKYSIDNDKFIREIWCNSKEKFLTYGKKYRLYAEFETGAMISGKCFIIYADNKQFMGFDSLYFMEEYQWDATKKYNL